MKSGLRGTGEKSVEEIRIGDSKQVGSPHQEVASPNSEVKNPEPRKEDSGGILDVEGFRNTTGLTLPKKYLSPSQISKYIKCPRQYYHSYVEQRPRVKNASLVTGSAVHSVLEVLAEVGRKDCTPEEIQVQLNNAFSDQMESVTFDEDAENAMKEYTTHKDSIVRSLVRYYNEEFSKLNIVAQECQVNADVPITMYDVTPGGNVGRIELGSITCSGKIDFINYPGAVKLDKLKSKVIVKQVYPEHVDNLEIGDYKTGKDKKLENYAGDVQMPFYSFATGIRQTRWDNIFVPNLVFNKAKKGVQHLSTKSTLPGYKVVKWGIQDGDIEDFLWNVSSAALGIGGKSYGMCPPGSFLCSEKFCEYWSICRGRTDKVFAVENLDVVSSGDAAESYARKETDVSDVQ